MEKQRLSYIDFTKGIAIILVIFAHSLNHNTLSTAIIYSFHMPLFFVCSGITTKATYNKSSYINKIGKIAKKTLIPASCIFLINSAYELLINNQTLCWTFVKKRLLVLLFALGDDDTVGGINVDKIGMVWFLVAFFFAQLIFLFIRSFIVKKMQIIAICILATGGFLIGRATILPLDIDIAMVMTIFLLGGVIYKKYFNKYNSLIMIVASLFFWGILFFPIYILRGHYLNIAVRSYPIFPLSLIAAYAATIFILEIGKKVSNFKYLKIVTIVGKNSMTLFLIHSLDKYWDKLFSVTRSNQINGMVRVLIDLIVLAIVLIINKKIRGLRLIKNEKNHFN